MKSEKAILKGVIGDELAECLHQKQSSLQLNFSPS